MIDASAELSLTLPEPEVSLAEVQQLVAALVEMTAQPPDTPNGSRNRPAGWFTAAEIATKLGDDWSDREVRKVASAAGAGIVSFPGSPGYKLWGECTVAEIDHCIDAFESQARDMIKRAHGYRLAYHRRFRGLKGDSSHA